MLGRHAPANKGITLGCEFVSPSAKAEKPQQKGRWAQRLSVIDHHYLSAVDIIESGAIDGQRCDQQSMDGGGGDGHR